MAGTRLWVLPIRVVTWAWVMRRRRRHLGEPEGELLGVQLFHPGGDGGFVGRIGVDLGEELIPGAVVELFAAHRMSSCFW
jgi:hypothetical protein